MATEQSETDDSVLETQAPAHTAPAAPVAWVNLSAEISATIAREPGDRVRCTWISGNNYRCNWWSSEGTTGYDNPGMSGLTVTTHRVRKSEFLSVTKVSDRLVIRNRSPRREVGCRIG